MAENGSCESCVFYCYDEEEEVYFCEVDMDEDEAARLISDRRAACPYYRLDDEYAVVRHQM